VFVEKPLCLAEAELEEIAAIHAEKPGARLMVGFNRRFAPQMEAIRKEFAGDSPKAINYRINAGATAPEHWTQDPEIGGGRIVGEVCHFLDLAMCLAGAPPRCLFAAAAEDPRGLRDTLNVNLLFRNGSIANVSYFANGSKALKKERLEVFSSGKTAVLDDFVRLEIYSKSRKTTKRSSSQDKGHRAEVQAFLDSVRRGAPAPIPFGEIYYSMRMTFDVIKSLSKGEAVRY